MIKKIQTFFTSNIIRTQTAWSLLAKITSALFGVVILIIVPKYWGVESYGAFSLFIAYITIVEIFFGNAINTALKKEVAEHGFSGEGRQLLLQGVYVKSGLFVLGIIGLLIFLLINPLTLIISNLFYFLCLLFLMNYCGLIVNCLEVSHSVFYVFLMYVIEYAIKFTLLMAFLFTDNKSFVSLVQMMIGGYLLAFMYGTFVLIRKYNFSIKDVKFFIDFERIKNLLRRTFHLALAVVSVVILTKIDLIILSKYTDAFTVGYYALAVELTKSASFIGAAFIVGSLPFFAKKHLDQRKLYVKQTKILMLINLPIVFLIAILGPLLIDLIYGTGFSLTKKILIILSVYPFLITLQAFTGEILNIKGQTKILLKNGIVAVFINLSMSLLLVRHFGAEGVAVATICAYFIWMALNRIFLRRLLALQNS